MSELTDEQVAELVEPCILSMAPHLAERLTSCLNELLELRAKNETLVALAARMAEAIDALCGDDAHDSPNWHNAASALFEYRREYPTQPSALADNGGGSGTQEADDA